MLRPVSSWLQELRFEAMPALHRFRAKILMETRRRDAVAELEVSLAVARGQSALTEQLRSETLLARILKDTDRATDARDRLSLAYQAFTQGHDFPDLKQAARVLASMT